ncbi:putative palmitoyltransferase PFA5 [Rosellinia necatrix]|uniref:Palmitoyltransferase n=1 Tax=Rosellinia necatrix TaxID=77044 RepID=A0A1W2TNL4_ROSNE|nr:putative palmitoyltransferase PFA5 [Rosellinia necatrix]
MWVLKPGPAASSSQTTIRAFFITAQKAPTSLRFDNPCVRGAVEEVRPHLVWQLARHGAPDVARHSPTTTNHNPLTATISTESPRRNRLNGTHLNAPHVRARSTIHNALGMPAIESTRAATRWTTRIVPVFLAAAVAYATYVVVARVCLDYLIRSLHADGTAVAILVLYFVFLLLMISTYARTLYNANFDPGAVPLGPKAVERLREKDGRRREPSYGPDDIEGRAYEAAPDNNPDSPGLECFYSRDAFVCENDGRPKWCSECCNWKQDRVHHSREIGRCVYRMDHYCPWAGGMIGEKSFKFFVQFTTYTALYCAVVLGATAHALRQQIGQDGTVDPYLLATIVIAAFFGLFSFSMSLTSTRYIFLNTTTVDILLFHQRVYQVAVRVPRGTRSDRFGVVVYPLPKPEASSGDNKRRANGLSPTSHSAGEQSDTLPATSRDDLATRTFAILDTKPGENPWDLGPWRNWQSVMGTSLLDWMLPIRHSPCANHESQESLYPMNRILDQLRSRYGLSMGSPSDESTVIEMRGLRS